MNVSIKKIGVVTSAMACLAGAGVANATQVTVKVQNQSTLVMLKTSGTTAVPATVAANSTTTPVVINFNNSGSTVTAVYSLTNGHVCSFKVTHKLISSGGTLIPEFDKTATQTGTGSQYGCSANLNAVKYVAPYDYTVTFGML